MSKNINSRFSRVIAVTNGISLGTTSKDNFITFSDFSTSLNSCYKFSTGKFATMNSLVLCYLLHSFTFILGDTRTVLHLAGSAELYNIPVFLSIFINKFFIKVQSYSNSESNLSGSISCGLSFTDFFNNICVMSYTEYCYMIEGSPFSHLTGISDFIFFRKTVESFIRVNIIPGFKMLEINTKDGQVIVSKEKSLYTLPGEPAIINSLMHSFVLFKALFYRDDYSLPYASGIFSNSVTGHINIHRFYQIGDISTYASNAYSLAAVGGIVFDEMVCFLFMYRPLFSKGVDSDIHAPHCIREGDARLDLSSIQCDEVLKFLFSIEVTGVKSRDPSRDKRASGLKGRPPFKTTGNGSPSKTLGTDPSGSGGEETGNRTFSTVSRIINKPSLVVGTMEFNFCTVVYSSPFFQGTSVFAAGSWHCPQI